MNDCALPRRQFIKIIALSGLTVGLGTALMRRLIQSDQVTPVEETRGAIGTYIRLVLLTPDQAAAQQAVAATFTRIAHLESILSRHRVDSALGRLNAVGRLSQPPPELLDVLRKSRQVFDWTQGAFDVTIGALANSIEHAAKRGSLPAPTEIQAALQRVGFEKILIQSDEIAFQQEGLALTLDGIAKGYIVDAAVAELEQQGFTQVMVDAGGDMGSTPRNDGSSWRIGIQDPRQNAGQSLGVTALSGNALATSGDYLHAYTADLSLNHILDPRTGTSPQELSSVSVLASSAWQADALATGLMVMGSQAGLNLIEQLPGVECLLVTKTARIISSAGFPFES